MNTDLYTIFRKLLLEIVNDAINEMENPMASMFRLRRNFNIDNNVGVIKYSAFWDDEACNPHDCTNILINVVFMHSDMTYFVDVFKDYADIGLCTQDAYIKLDDVGLLPNLSEEGLFQYNTLCSTGDLTIEELQAIGVLASKIPRMRTIM